MKLKKKILIMGLPGSGKTYLAKKLFPLINAAYLNADKVRKDFGDYDFSPKGRERQAKRMCRIAKKYLKKNKHVVADFICPTHKTRKQFDADVLIWMDTIKKSRYDDTNQLFLPPKKADFRIKKKNGKLWALRIAKKILK